MPAQGDASVTTGSAPSRAAVHSAAPVRRAAERAAGKKALLENGIPQHSASMPSG